MLCVAIGTYVPVLTGPQKSELEPPHRDQGD